MRTTYLTATLLAVACLLAACGGGETAEPIFTPSTSNTSTSPSPSTTDQEDPEDFIRRWRAASDNMQNSGDTSRFRSLYLPSCSNCEALADSVDEVYGAGGSISFDGSEVIWIRAGENRFHYSARISNGSARVVPHQGAAKEAYPPGESTMDIALRPRRGTWVIVSYAPLATDG